MNEIFLARFPDRVTLSKKLGLDLAQHPVELLMAAHQRMRALDRTEGSVPHASHAPEVQAVEAPDIAVRSGASSP
jgi:hypothetical protein